MSGDVLRDSIIFAGGPILRIHIAITDDMVDRAAEAQWDRDDHDNMWADADHDRQCPQLREDYRTDARAVLEAALNENGDR